MRPDQYLEPDWSTASRVHDWMNYISDDLRAMWGTFTLEQKRAIAQSAEAAAMNEEWD